MSIVEQEDDDLRVVDWDPRRLAGAWEV